MPLWTIDDMVAICVEHEWFLTDNQLFMTAEAIASCAISGIEVDHKGLTRILYEQYAGNRFRPSGDSVDIIRVHGENDDCKNNGCSIHNPTDHHMRDFPQSWNGKSMERICPCGARHPDPDQVSWGKRTFGDEFDLTSLDHICCDKKCCEND